MSDNAKVTELEGQVAGLEATIADFTKKLAAMKKNGEGDGDEGGDFIDASAMATELDAIAKALEESSAALETLTAERDAAVAYIEKAEALSPKHRAYFDTLAKKDRPAFLDMEDEEKEEEVEKMTKAEESVVIEGQTIKKSVVGDAPFAVMKAQAERIAKTEADLAKQRQEAAMAKLEKQAEDEFKHVPGTVQERAQMLEVIGKQDEGLKKAFLAVFTQSEKLAKAGFGKVGVGDGGSDDLSKRRGSGGGDSKISKAQRDFDAKVNEIRKRDKCSQTDAFSKARKEEPDLFKAYQEDGGAPAAS